MKTKRAGISPPRALGSWALLLPGVVALQPTFGGWSGYLVSGVGVSVGALIAVVASHYRWRPVYWFAAVLGAYLLLGGKLVVPETTIAGFIPSLETLARLVTLVAHGWMDLLTVGTPAGDISGASAVPLLAGLVVGATTVGIACSTKAVSWPLLPPLVWLGFCIAFGTRTAPLSTWLGAVFGAGVLIWLTAHRLRHITVANNQILLRQGFGTSSSLVRALSAGLVIVLAAGTAVGVNLVTGDRVNRQVLRDAITPPLDPQEYTSPLMSYRRYEVALKETVLFRVEGMPAGTRLRLAVLDTYDGNVFNVSPNANQYVRSGRELPWGPEQATAGAKITATAYDDVWLPSFGDSTRIEFSGADAARQLRGLHVNRGTHQAMTTARLTPDTTIDLNAAPVRVLPPEEHEKLSAAGPGQAPLAVVSRVPDVLVKNATEWTEEATSAHQQLEIIAERLRADGYYSDGSDGKARSGHTNERLSTMFNAAGWVGDDEQYATAMALMATQLGIPVRVVMGFHPLKKDPPSGQWEVTGTQAHVWVEANLAGAGWVAFDPTPDRDKKPKTDIPQPKPKPKPQVDPPPNPPEKLPEEPIIPDKDPVNVDEEKPDLSGLLGILLILGVTVGSLAILVAPFAAILIAKSVRAKRRRIRGEVPDQLAGAWDEVADRARDLGHPMPSSATRHESATVLQRAYPDVSVLSFADRIDASIYGAIDLDERHRNAAWKEVDGLKRGLGTNVSWMSRMVAFISIRSLRKRRTEAAGSAPRRRITRSAASARGVQEPAGSSMRGNDA